MKIRSIHLLSSKYALYSSTLQTLNRASPHHLISEIAARSCSTAALPIAPITTTLPPFQLLGPPEIYANQPPEIQNNTQPSSTIDPFMELMVANFNKTVLSPSPPPPPYKGFTENGSPTFLSSGNPCVDFFFHIVPDTPPQSLIQRLELAWKHDSLTALKLICHLRDIRGTGKSDREGFYTSALWLHHNHPKTLANNVKFIPQFGYFKDLPEILYRLLEGPDVRDVAKQTFHTWKAQKDLRKRFKRYQYINRSTETVDEVVAAAPGWVELARDPSTGCVCYYNESIKKSQWVSPEVASAVSASPSQSLPLPPDWQESTDGRPGRKRYHNTKTGISTRCIGCSEGGWGRFVHEWGYCDHCRRNQGRKLGVPQKTRLAAEKKKKLLKGKSVRTDKVMTKAKRAVERYYSDEDFRVLHDHISNVFADQLVSDLKSLNSGEVFEISFASKWCPSLYSSYDYITLLCESIAKRVFPRDSSPEYQEIEEAHYAYRVRDRLRKQVLVPFHKIKELPEIYMSSNRWNSLPYNYVPSVAMKNYKKLFFTHDEERFKEYLGKVKEGKAKIAAGALLRHEIINHLNDGEEDGGQVAELQWKRMVDDLSVKGKLKNCIAVCDVSGSMRGTPMDVCVALGLLVSELSEDPWKGKVITFSQNLQLQKITGDDLRSKTWFIQQMDWGANTDFQKVFDMILQVTKDGILSRDQMIKRVFVFSDMEFDEARKPIYGWQWQQQCTSNDSGDGTWNTDYEEIQRKFGESGYPVPEIVFWNLRDSQATPVTSKEKGIALVSGFSKNAMKLFLDEKDMPTPEAVMELALSGVEYNQLVVVD